MSFIITQKDPKVLYYVKKNLGYGKVYLCGDKYYRYVVSNREGIARLIKTFSGRLRLNKTNERYAR